jgi:hypothetical protein
LWKTRSAVEAEATGLTITENIYFFGLSAVRFFVALAGLVTMIWQKADFGPNVRRILASRDARRTRGLLVGKFVINPARGRILQASAGGIIGASSWFE